MFDFGVRDEVRSLKYRFEQMEKKMSDTTTQIEAISAEITTLFASANAEIATANTTLTSLSEQITTLTAQINGGSGINQINASLATLKAQLDAVVITPLVSVGGTPSASTAAPVTAEPAPVTPEPVTPEPVTPEPAPAA